MKKICFLIFFIFTIISLHSAVVNYDKPLKGKWDFAQQKIWETETAGENVFGEVQNIAVAESGDVFVADMKNSLIFMFDRNGRFIKKFGKKGEGPGELREYFGGDQLHVTEDSVIFADRAMLHYFDLKGTYVRTVPFSPNLRVRGFVDSDSFISAPPTVDTRDGSRAEMVLYNLKTQKTLDIVSFKPFEKATDTQESGGRQITVGIVIGDITPLMMVAYRNGKLYYGMSSINKINICDIKGKHLLSFSNPEKEQNPVSREYLNDLKARLGEVPANMLKNIIDGLPKHASCFSNIHVDENGNIYLFESDPGNRISQVIDIYSKEGKFAYRGSISVQDEQEISNLTIYGSFAYIATEDEDGNVALTKYLIRLPE